MPADFELEVSTDPLWRVYFDLNGAGKALVQFSAKLGGFAIRNMSSSSTAAMDFYDGTDTTGNAIVPITLAANESTREYWWPGGVLFKNGVYANVTSGEIKGSIFYRHIRL